MSRLPPPENPVPEHELGKVELIKNVVEARHVVETVESRAEREEPVVTRKVWFTQCFSEEYTDVL